jgi:hypothetical protein
VGLLLAGLLGISAPASAASQRVSKGDAEAGFQAFGTGGLAIINHSPVDLGAPADHDQLARISAIVDGRHYCAEDWHTIALGDLGGGDKTYTQQKFAEQAGRDFIRMFLDGTVLPTTRTASKAITTPEQFGFEKAYFFYQGIVLSPSDLSVGTHSLVTQFDLDGFGIGFFNVNFYIDASGSGVCL